MTVRKRCKALILPDVLAVGMHAVFCGTAVSEASKAAKGYYAGPGNKFWPILHSTGLTDRELKPLEYEKLRGYRLGLTDLAKNRSGSDADLRASDFDLSGFKVKIRDNAPVIVAFNGLNAARKALKTHALEYGLQSATIHGAKVWVLPSTSNQANTCWDDGPWIALAEEVKRLGKTR